MTLAEKYAEMTPNELEQAWRDWHEEAGKARRQASSVDYAHREIVQNVEAVDAEVERRGLVFDE